MNDPCIREEIPDFEQHVIDEHLEHVRELFGGRWAV